MGGWKYALKHTAQKRLRRVPNSYDAFLPATSKLKTMIITIPRAMAIPVVIKRAIGNMPLVKAFCIVK